MPNLTILSKDVRTLDHLYSLNDLHKASGNQDKHRPIRFIRLEQTKELIREIDQRPDLVFATYQGGRNQGTWVCKELVYSYAMWISAKFHLQVIRAFDAMSTSPQQGITLTEKQARFAQCTFNQMDKLKARYLQTKLQYQAMVKQVATMKAFCDQIENNLKSFQSDLDADLDIVNHIHLYKGMVLDYQGASELKDFIDRQC